MTRKIEKFNLGEIFCGAGGFAEGAKKLGSIIWGTDNHSDSCDTFKKSRMCELLHGHK